MNQAETANWIKEKIKKEDFIIKKGQTNIFDIVNFIGYLNGINPSASVNTLAILKDSSVTLEDVITNTLNLLNKSDNN